jgi:AbrB family looped-hinge helix DNA binding protein
MVAEVTKITRDGQVTIPIGIRQELGLVEGDPMVVEERDGVMIIRRATIVEQTAGALAPWRRIPPLTLEEEEEQLARAIGEEGARYE